jgi:hydroxysqualene dehydroxylase
VTAQRAPVAIIGGGWAGCAAALALADLGLRVALYEAAGTLGGRARRVTSDGLPLDNGQHLLLGAYVETRRAMLLARAGMEGLHAAPPFAMAPLAVVPFSPQQSNALTLRARRLPAPFGLLAGLLLAQGLPLRARIATARWFARLRGASYRCARDATVSDMLAPLPPGVADRLWTPLCLAALNTAPDRASGQVFANVLRATFDGAADASDLLVHAADLTALFPDAVARWLTARGHEVHVQAAAHVARLATHGPIIMSGASERVVAAVIVAVGPHQLARAFTPELIAGNATIAEAVGQVDRLAYEPIVTVYLGYAGAVAVPAGLVRLDDSPGQWLFDRRDVLARAQSGTPAPEALLAVVISAQGTHEALEQSELVAAVDKQLRRLSPGLPRLVWSRVIAERRATYACTPNAPRPRAGRLCAGVYLAGDYTDDEFPATLEAAVKSGRRAAEAAMADRPG